MNKLLLAVPAIALSLGASTLLSNPVSAASGYTSGSCNVVAVGKTNTAAAGGMFVINGNNTVTATVNVTGANCAMPVTLTSWTAPDGVKGQPYSEQHLFAHTTITATTGTNTITVAMPDCFYQIDLIPGANATDSNGGPEYNTYGGQKLLGSLHGGTQVCTPGKGGGDTTPVVTPTAVTELPNTGTKANVAVFALLAAIAGGVAYNLRLQRKATR